MPVCFVVVVVVVYADCSVTDRPTSLADKVLTSLRHVTTCHITYNYCLNTLTPIRVGPIYSCIIVSQHRPTGGAKTLYEKLAINRFSAVANEYFTGHSSLCRTHRG